MTVNGDLMVCHFIVDDKKMLDYKENDKNFIV